MNEELIPQQEQSFLQATLEPLAIMSLLKTISWMKFISIAGFITIGIFVFTSLMAYLLSFLHSTNSMYSNKPILFLIILPIFILTFINYYFLLRYSMKLKSFGLKGKSEFLTEAFIYQKKYWKFQSIIMITGFFFGIVASVIMIFSIGHLAK